MRKLHYCSYANLFICLLLSQQLMYAHDALINHVPAAMVYNPGPLYSLVNSIDHHPKRNLFCVTYTHNNMITLYTLNALGKPEVIQNLCNPQANLCEPQHAAFSPDGGTMVVANWFNQTITVYQSDKDGYFQEEPAAVISPPAILKYHKPHGVAFSPCGNYVAIAYGAATYNEKAVVLYSVTNGGLGLELAHMLRGPDELPGIPKGITFSPDGTCLLVTFSDVHQFTIYDLLDNKRIVYPPRQVIQGKESGLSRPEDVKIFANGKYCAVSNSDRNTVTFYPFDTATNRITQCTPIEILQNPEACFCFPHGITFSPDGAYMLVTEFGMVDVTKEGDIVWGRETRPEVSKFNLYTLKKN